MNRLILSAGARVYSATSNPKLTDPLFYDIFLSVTNADGSVTDGLLDFSCAQLAPGEEGDIAYRRIEITVDPDFPVATGFHRLTFPQPLGQIPKTFAVTVSQVVAGPPVGRPPKPHFTVSAQGLIVVSVTPEPGFYGRDIAPPQNGQFFLGCVKTN